MAIHGNQLILGGPGSALGSSGAAFIFERSDNGQWRQSAELVPSEVLSGLFGVSVAIFGDYCVVGAPGSSNEAGAAHVFQLDHARGTWKESAVLTPPASLANPGGFGTGVAIYGNEIAVSMLGDRQSRLGAVTLYQRQMGDGAWTEKQTLRATKDVTTEFYFGSSVDLEHDTLAVGSGRLYFGAEPGSCIIYERQPAGDFARAATFDDGGVVDSLGSRVSIDGDTVVAGTALGEARLYRKEEGLWSEYFRFRGGQEFGNHVAIDGDILMVNDSNDIRTDFSVSRGVMKWIEYDGSGVQPRPYFTGKPVTFAEAGLAYEYPVTLSADATVSAGPLLPAWLKLMKTTSGYVLAGTPSAADVGTVFIEVAVGDASGAVADIQSFTIEVQAAAELPMITADPVAVSVRVGLQARFRVEATATGQLHYTWLRNGDPVEGAPDSPEFTIAFAEGEDAGAYSVAVSNSAGTTLSGPALLEVLPPTRVSGPWSGSGGSGERSSYAPSTFGGGEFRELWSASIGSGLPAAIAAGRVFVSHFSSGDSTPVCAFNLYTGELEWRADLVNTSPVAYADGRLFAKESFMNAFGDPGRMRALDAFTGSILWSRDIMHANQNTLSPLVVGSQVWAEFEEGPQGFDVVTGADLFSVDGRRDRTLVATDGQRLFHTEGSLLRASVLKTGQEVWSKPLSGITQGQPVVSGEKILMNTEAGMIALDTATGAQLWRTQPARIGFPVANDGFFYGVSFDEQALFEFDLDTGTLTRKVDTTISDVFQPSGYLENMAVTDDLIIFSTNTDVQIFSRRTLEKLQTLPTPGYISLSDDILIIVDHTSTDELGGAKVHAYSTGTFIRPELHLPKVAAAGVAYAGTLSVPPGTEKAEDYRFGSSVLPLWLTLEDRGDGTAFVGGTPPAGAAGKPQNLVLYMDAPDGRRVTEPLQLKVSESPLPVVARISSDRELTAGMPLRLRSLVNSPVEGVTYQWLKDGVPIESQTGPHLLIDSPTDPDAGSYVLRATNAFGSVDSPEVRITFVPRSIDAGSWSTLGGNSSRTGHYPAWFGGAFTPAFEKTIEPNVPLNPVSVGNGRIVVSYDPRLAPEPKQIFGLDFETGTTVWSYTVRGNGVNSVTTPTLVNNEAVFGVNNAGGDSLLLALGAQSGRQVASVTYYDQWARYTAPAATDDALYLFAGQQGLVAAANSATYQRLFIVGTSPDPFGTVQSISTSKDGRVFVHRYGRFTEHDAATGAVLWEVETTPGAGGAEEWDFTTAVVTDSGNAYALGSPGLFRIDLAARSARRVADGEFIGSPAYADGIVYALRSDAVVAIDDITEEELSIFPSEGASLVGQPVITSDLVIASSRETTLVFDRWSGLLRQRINAGGRASVSNGRLYIASHDGILRGYRLDRAPEFTSGTEAQTIREDEPFRLAIAWADPDGTDLNGVRFQALTLPEWLAVTGESEGSAVLEGTPRQEHVGVNTLVLSLSDALGNTTEATIELAVEEVNDPPTVQPATIAADEDSAPLEIDLSALAIDEEDGRDLMFHLAEFATDDPVLGQISLAGPTVTAILRPDASGAATISFIVTDTGGLQTQGSINISITEIPDAPRAVGIPDLTASPDAADVSVDLSPFFNDPDPGDRLTYQVIADPSAPIFRLLELDTQSGMASVKFAPYVDGIANLAVRVTDTTGRSVDSTWQVALPPLPSPTVTASGSPILNRQTGLLEQKLVITSLADRAAGGVSVAVSGLSDSIRVANRTESESEIQGDGTLVQRLVASDPIPPRGEITLIVEFYSPSRELHEVPEFSADAIVPREDAPHPGSIGSFEIDRVVMLNHESVLVEFSSEAGSSYRIEYSDDGENWKVSPVVVIAGGNRTQWIDRGLPRTVPAPTDATSRWYRVVRE
ncbi:MAG: PQQ-binding-like beta-propeller repeat protein [Verrucomicrobiales bacterium]